MPTRLGSRKDPNSQRAQRERELERMGQQMLVLLKKADNQRIYFVPRQLSQQGYNVYCEFLITILGVPTYITEMVGNLGKHKLYKYPAHAVGKTIRGPVNQHLVPEADAFSKMFGKAYDFAFQYETDFQDSEYTVVQL